MSSSGAGSSSATGSSASSLARNSAHAVFGFALAVCFILVLREANLINLSVNTPVTESNIVVFDAHHNNPPSVTSAAGAPRVANKEPAVTSGAGQKAAPAPPAPPANKPAPPANKPAPPAPPGKKPREMLPNGKPKLRIAICITIARVDGAKAFPFLDMAVIMAYSARQAGSKHDIRFIAFVLPEVSDKGREVAQARLSAGGWEVQVAPVPVQWADVADGPYKEGVNASGALGFTEFLRLQVYNLDPDEFDFALNLDADCYINHNMDELFETAYERGIEMAHTQGSMPGELWSGGFWMVKPSKEVLKIYTDIIKEGDFRKGSGWRGSKIGWYWGGQTIQGLCAYYTYKLLPKEKSWLVDTCIYNNQAHEGDCGNYTMEQTKLVQFSRCGKPTGCRIRRDKRICKAHTEGWWELKDKFEKDKGITPTKNCIFTGTYEYMHLEELNPKAAAMAFDTP